MGKFLTNLSASVCIATGVVLTSSVMLPAYAFNITQTGGTAGNPSQPLWQVGATTSDVGKTFQTNWTLNANQSLGLTQNLTASASYTLAAFTSNYIDLQISLTNTTTLSTLSNANILSFGFGVDPNATSVSFLGGTGQIFDLATVQNGQQQFPGGFKQIDLCMYAANNCAGGNVNQGLTPGSTDTFTLRIGGNFSSGVVNFADFPIKFQTSAGSFELAGAGTSGGTGGGGGGGTVDGSIEVNEVPEPLTMLGTGLALGLGAAFKKEYEKRNKKGLQA